MLLVGLSCRAEGQCKCLLLDGIPVVTRSSFLTACSVFDFFPSQQGWQLLRGVTMGQHIIPGPGVGLWWQLS